MLFRPTNITPDATGPLGNGTIDVTMGLSVSWQVNGNSALTAYQIVIYTNDAASTQKFSTGKVTLSVPFYGTAADGTVQFFTAATIPPQVLVANSITNGNEYKLIVTQYWTEGGSEQSLTQASASAFTTRATPSLTIDTIASPLAVRSYDFTATYTQAQGDALNWVRWRLALASDTDNPLFDSQNIYGTGQLAMSYDGLFSDNTYAVRCTVQTESGIEADTGWVSFDVSYALSTLDGFLEATPVVTALGPCAVKLEWTRVKYIPVTTATGNYSIADGQLTLPTGASVLWNQSNGDSMSIGAPWTILYKGSTVRTSDSVMTSAPYGAALFSVDLEDGATLTLYYYDPTAPMSLRNKLRLEYTAAGSIVVSHPIVTVSGVQFNATISAVVTPSYYYIRIDTVDFAGPLFPSKGLYPSKSLYPSLGASSTGLVPANDLYPDDTLYPAASVLVPSVIQKNGDFSATYETALSQAIASVQLGAVQVCDFLQILDGYADDATITAVYGGTYTETWGSGTVFLASFEDGTLNAGSVGSGGTAVTGYALYRRLGDEGTLHHIADLDLATSTIYDFGATNTTEGDTYTYYLFAQSSTAYIAEPFVSGEIAMCDWTWQILSCVYDSANGYYTVAQAYRFGKNLTTGTISNNNQPGVLRNFTRYPLVQKDAANYQSGTLTSLIGVIDGATCAYSDTKTLRDAIWALSTTGNTLFLKSRKGDLLKIAITGAITMDTDDGSREQAQTASVSWAEVGDASGVAIIQIPA